jgi:hypothetical protein
LQLASSFFVVHAFGLLANIESDELQAEDVSSSNTSSITQSSSMGKATDPRPVSADGPSKLEEEEEEAVDSGIGNTLSSQDHAVGTFGIDGWFNIRSNLGGVCCGFWLRCAGKPANLIIGRDGDSRALGAGLAPPTDLETATVFWTLD